MFSVSCGSFGGSTLTSSIDPIILIDAPCGPVGPCGPVAPVGPTGPVGPPDDSSVIDPGPLVIIIPGPAISLDLANVLPVELPINKSPSS